jgi:DNA-binding transcriptional MerR regulator
MKRYRISEISAVAGVSSRTLHHYESIGLLQPVARTSGGHRLYAEEALWRLTQIRLLKSVGLSLDEIGSLLNPESGVEPAVLLQGHLHAVRSQISHLQEVCRRLEPLLEYVEDEGAATSANEFVALVRLVDEALREQPSSTRAQLMAYIADHASDENAREWEAIMGGFEQAHASGQSADAPEVQSLAGRLHALMSRLMPSLESSASDPPVPDLIEMLVAHGVSKPLAVYVDRALKNALQKENRV